MIIWFPTDAIGSGGAALVASSNITSPAPVPALHYSTDLPESSHPYQPDILNNAYGRIWNFDSGFGDPAQNIAMTFSPDTHFVDGKGLLAIYDAEGNAVSGSPFTDYELAGRTIFIPGDICTLQLVGVDGAEQASPTYDGTAELDWGFKVTKVKAAINNTYRGRTAGDPLAGPFNPPQRGGNEFKNVVTGPFNYCRKIELNAAGNPTIRNEFYQVFASTKGVLQEGYESTAPDGGLLQVWRTVNTGGSWVKVSVDLAGKELQAGATGASMPCAYHHREYLGHLDLSANIGRIYMFNLDASNQTLIHVFDCDDAGGGIPGWLADITGGPTVDVTVDSNPATRRVGGQQRAMVVLPAFSGAPTDVIIMIAYNVSVGGKDQVWINTYETATNTWGTPVNVSPNSAFHWTVEGMVASTYNDGSKWYVHLLMHKNKVTLDTVDYINNLSELYHLGVWSDGTVSANGETQLTDNVYGPDLYHRTGIPTVYKAKKLRISSDLKSWFAYSYCFVDTSLGSPFDKMTQLAVVEAEDTGEVGGALTFTTKKFFIHTTFNKFGYTGAWLHYGTGIVPGIQRSFMNPALPQKHFATACIGKETGLYVFVTENWATNDVLSTCYYYWDKGDVGAKGWQAPIYLDYTRLSEDPLRRAYGDPKLGLVARSVTAYPNVDKNLTVGIMLCVRSEW